MRPLILFTVFLFALAAGAEPNTGTYFERAANGLVTCYLRNFDISNQAFYDGEGCSARSAGAALVDLPVTVRADMEIRSIKTIHAERRYANSEEDTGKISFTGPKGKRCEFTLTAQLSDDPDKGGDADMQIEGPVACH